MIDKNNLSDSELLNLIKEARGINIYHGYSIDRKDYWTVAGGGVNAGGYETLEEALQIWGKTQTWAKDN